MNNPLDFLVCGKKEKENEEIVQMFNIQPWYDELCSLCFSKTVVIKHLVVFSFLYRITISYPLIFSFFLDFLL
ncbi:hypothetical protein I7I48_02842 [Histoplasma ohiense]|nr:hypothetical protein I7I48_02842 [Histoplasma ohiense (nom. inval.)]